MRLLSLFSFIILSTLFNQSLSFAQDQLLKWPIKIKITKEGITEDGKFYKQNVGSKSGYILEIERKNSNIVFGDENFPIRDAWYNLCPDDMGYTNRYGALEMDAKQFNDIVIATIKNEHKTDILNEFNIENNKWYIDVKFKYIPYWTNERERTVVFKNAQNNTRLLVNIKLAIVAQVR